MTNAVRVSTQTKQTVFSALFEANYARVLSLAVGQLADHDAAEDVAADVFRIAWEKLDPHDPLGLPWLLRTTLNRTRDVNRMRSRRSAALDTLADRARASGGPEDLERIALYEAMARLSASERVVIELTYWAELSAGEVAQVLRIREGAVWTRAHRARAKLRELLDSPAEAGVDNG